MTAASTTIAAFSAGFNASRLTPELVRACARAFLDTYAVGLAGRNEDAAQRVLRYVRFAAGGGGCEPASRARCWGTGEVLPLELAALWNGVAAHVLDYDDVTSPLRGHPSVALLPALLALGEATDAGGLALARAYVVGFEVICKLSRAFAVAHYARGWHSTSSIGTVAAAVACANLLGLDAARTSNAIGLGVSQAAGTRANFGTDAKSFQAGQCNAGGLRAALLAREGFEASSTALDGEFGYMDLYADGESLSDELAGLGREPLELECSGIEVKKYPLCYATHRTLDGILDLRAEHGLRLDQVRAVNVTTSAGALTPLIHHRPDTGLEGKFSLEYAVVAALLDGQVGLASFTDEAVRRPQAQAALARVSSRADSESAVFPRWSEIEITLNDGRSLQRRIDLLRGSADAPLTDAELRTKLVDCLAWGRVDVDVDTLWQRAMRMERTQVRSLLDGVSVHAGAST